ncbi:hypothetical protein [Pseudomonas sp. R3-18-08]|uniref:hypothetical protein n=1 Tax=Pseudomonas sp. R3-18-08 TaxID=1173283 RepID=UPI000F5817F3|nr:hypothetical protein [Pseudomonas sp. R3-18-08]AZF17978.1 hypothetical protein C4J92_4532 [Pseudomonas sp. R3-18-08]
MSTMLMWLTFSGALLALLAAILYFRDALYAHVSDFLKHHQAYNNFVIASCALATFVWGAYTFDALQQKDRAVAELADIQKRIRDTESTFLSVKVSVSKAPDGYYLTPVVTIKNSSNEAIYFKLCPDSLSVSKISYSFEGQARADKTIYPLFYERISDNPQVKNNPLYDLRVPISSDRDLSFFAAVKELGVYYITFSALSSKDAAPDINNGDCSFNTKKNIAGGSKINGKDSIWFASSYVIIAPEDKK